MIAAKPPDALTDEEREKGQGELAKLIGAEEAAKFSWLRRLAIAPDGSTVIEVKVPAITREQLMAPSTAFADCRYIDTPWAFPDRHPAAPLEPGMGGRPGMLANAEFLPLEEAVGLLTGPDALNPETEIARRFACLYRAIEIHNEHAQRMIDERKERVAAQKAWEAGRGDRWRALPRDVRVYLKAAATGPRSGTQALLALAAAATKTEDELNESIPDTFEAERA